MKLKPCPFCGGEAETEKVELYGKVRNYFVVCKKRCVEQGRLYTSKQAAETAWNRRAEND